MDDPVNSRRADSSPTDTGRGGVEKNVLKCVQLISGNLLGFTLHSAFYPLRGQVEGNSATVSDVFPVFCGTVKYENIKPLNREKSKGEDISVPLPYLPQSTAIHVA